MVLAGSALVSAASSLSYPDLVKRLTDLEHLATLPTEGESTAQWSSYDRASKYDVASGKYIRWDANGDGGGYIRQEGGQFVFAEMEGPGCIFRIWSAAPEQGHVRIYLDGASEPAVDLPFKGYFDGKNPPFNRPALVHTAALGWNNYVPIPYQKSCKIVADKGWGSYFHFGYTTFPKGTAVPTFKRELSSDDAAALDTADAIWARRGDAAFAHRTGEKQVTVKTVVKAGGTTRVAKLVGPQAITILRVKVDLPPTPEDRNVLRELSLRIRWDGEAAASVWAPLGDFFGTAPGANPYRSLPLGLGDDGWWYSYWFMPFGKSADIELANAGGSERRASFEITTAALSLPIDQYARFHVKWHRDALLPAEPERAIDWPMVKTTGQGRFCGVMLHIWNPKGGWWGEGDEKFFVDGEKFPSTFGTGSEDYFGYAWSNPTLFQHAYHNQTIAMGNKGHISVNRWHISDQVPFHQSFEADIEKYYSNTRPALYAGTVYWYLAPGGKDPYEPRPISERLGYWSDITLFSVKGVIEGERLKVLSKTGGNANEQTLEGFEGDWSGDSQLWWTGAKPGDRLDLAVPVSKAGKYGVTVALTKAIDYGIVQLSLDGEKLGGRIDLYHEGVIPTGPLQLGTRDLLAGEHKLGVEIVGANPKAQPSYMFGLDYIKLEPAH